MSKVHMGHKASKEVKAKMRKAAMGNTNCLGYKHTEEHKANMSKALMGNNTSQIVYNFIHKDGQKRTCTQYELSTEFNLQRPNLCRVCSGKRKLINGWRIQW